MSFMFQVSSWNISPDELRDSSIIMRSFSNLGWPSAGNLRDPLKSLCGRKLRLPQSEAFLLQSSNPPCDVWKFSTVPGWLSAISCSPQKILSILEWLSAISLSLQKSLSILEWLSAISFSPQESLSIPVFVDDVEFDSSFKNRSRDSRISSTHTHTGVYLAQSTKGPSGQSITCPPEDAKIREFWHQTQKFDKCSHDSTTKLYRIMTYLTLEDKILFLDRDAQCTNTKMYPKCRQQPMGEFPVCTCWLLCLHSWKWQTHHKSCRLWKYPQPLSCRLHSQQGLPCTWWSRTPAPPLQCAFRAQ